MTAHASPTRASLGTAVVLIAALALLASLTAASAPSRAGAGPVAAPQTPAAGRVMRDKLVHSEKVLEAIMTSDFALLQRESDQLSRATAAPGWQVLLTPEYRRYSAEFTRVTEALIDAAQRRDLDAAAMHYVSLTLSCYQCHRYLKGARIVK